MPAIRLTEAAVEKLKPTDGKQVRYFDKVMPGLVLRINPGGTKLWQALHYIKVTDGATGKQRTEPRSHALGRFPHLKLAEAREAARKFLADPKAALAQAERVTFKQVAENFMKRHVEANDLVSKHEVRRCLERYIYPKWAEKPFVEIGRGDVTALLDEIQDAIQKKNTTDPMKPRDGAGQADHVLSIIGKIMRWHAARTDGYNPVLAAGMRRTKAAARKRKRILDDAEIAAMWKCASDLGTFGALVRVLLLTGQRREKVAQMHWTDVLDGKWTIRTTHEREKGHAIELTLPQMVLDIIKAQPRLSGNPHVFAGSARGQRPTRSDKPPSPPCFNSWSQRLRELHTKMRETLPEMTPWVIHDLRRTARSLMSRAGTRPDIAERVLGHAIPGVEGVYDRYSYAPEKAEALKQLAALIETITSPPKGNVVAIVNRRKKAAT